MSTPDLSLTSWAGLMAAAAIIGTCWRTIGAWLTRVADLAICRVILKEEAARALMSLVWMRGHRSPFGLRLYGGTTSFVFPKRRVEVVAYESVSSDPILFWVGGTPIVVAKGLGTDSPHIGDYHGTPVTIRFIRGTLNVDALVEDATKTYNDLRQSRADSTKQVNGPKRFNVVRMHGPARGMGGLLEARANGDKAAPPTSSSDSHDLITQIQRNELRLLTWRPDDLVERSNDAKPFVNHPIAPEVLAQFDEVHTWLAQEQWFRSKGVPWKRGYLLVSAPGGGKDTLVRNLAIRHDLPIYAFDLSSYDNRSFTDDWKQVMQNAPAIALCSDIDTVWHGRENVAVKDKTRDGLTFDCFLNTISGVGSSEGVLLFVTTNHLESIDPALGVPTNGGTQSTRPGRIDKVIRMGPMGEPERRKLAAIILSDYPDLIDATVTAGEDEMAAQFQERCAQLALAKWNAQHTTTL